MGTGLLITQRSRVQIPPPLLNQQVKALSYHGKGLLRTGRCSKMCSGNRAPGGLAANRGDGVTRDETAWTLQTLPPAIAGRLAQR